MRCPRMSPRRASPARHASRLASRSSRVSKLPILMTSVLPRSASSIATTTRVTLGDREAPVEDCRRLTADARVDLDLLHAPDVLQDGRVSQRLKEALSGDGICLRELVADAA